MPLNLRSLLQPVAPVLSPTSHKGQAGRVAVIGGCKAYTGAPYFAAMTTMKLGVDLTSVYCTFDAGTPIKSYSPDLMVDPVLHTTADTDVHDEKYMDSMKAIKPMLERCNSVIIGCGLGKDPVVQKQVSELIKYARQAKVPIVIDGDGLAIVNDNIQLVSGYKECILTPNAMEFHRLYKAALPDKPEPPMNAELDDNVKANADKGGKVDGDMIDCDSKVAKHTAELASALGNVTIVRKGRVDVVSNGQQAVYCCATGGLKRVGGQGDVTAGTVGTHLAWQHLKLKQLEQRKDDPSSKFSLLKQSFDEIDSVVLAGVGGCLFTRLCSRRAYEKHGRSMLTTDLLDNMPPVVDQLYPIGKSSL